MKGGIHILIKRSGDWICLTYRACWTYFNCLHDIFSLEKSNWKTRYSMMLLMFWQCYVNLYTHIVKYYLGCFVLESELANTEPFAPWGRTELGSCKLTLTTFLSTDQYMTLFCFCLKTPYSIHSVDSLAIIWLIAP